MKVKTRNVLNIVLTCFFAVMIPVLLLLYSCQAKRYSTLNQEIKNLEKKQQQLVEQNKKLISDISLVSNADEIERKANQELDMHKAESEEIVRVEVPGNKN